MTVNTLKQQAFSIGESKGQQLNDWQVYLLKCSDRSLYCGVTNNLENRVSKHNAGTASKYTRSRLPVDVVAVRKDLTKKEAFKLEYQIKKLSAGKKILALKNRHFKK